MHFYKYFCKVEYEECEVFTSATVLLHGTFLFTLNYVRLSASKGGANDFN